MHASTFPFFSYYDITVVLLLSSLVSSLVAIIAPLGARPLAPFLTSCRDYCYLELFPFAMMSLSFTSMAFKAMENCGQLTENASVTGCALGLRTSEHSNDLRKPVF